MPSFSAALVCSVSCLDKPVVIKQRVALSLEYQAWGLGFSVEATLNPKPLNPKPLNPKLEATLNPKSLNPKPLNPKPLNA